MAGRWVQNSQTGAIEWVADPAPSVRPPADDGSTRVSPTATQTPAIALTPSDLDTASILGTAPRAQQSASPAPSSTFLGHPVHAAGAPDPNIFGWRPHRAADGTFPLFSSPDSNAGSIIGDAIGRSAAAQQPLDFGDPNAISPEDQSYLDTLQSLTGMIGSRAMPATPQLPQAPTYTVDPALEHAQARAAERNTQVHGVLDQMAQSLRESDPQARNRWARFGEFLGNLAANGRLENAGAIMAQQLEHDRGMHEELQRQILQLTMAGINSDDAQALAVEQLMSGRHSATERTAEAAYQRDTAQTGLTQQHDIAAFQNQEGNVRAQVALAGDIASATRDAHSRSRDARRAAISAFASDPQYAGQAAEALAPDAFTDPRTRSAFGQQLTEHQASQGLMAQLNAANIADSNVRNQLAQFLREWNPSITAQTIEREGTMGTYMRAIQGPGARAAFARHPELARLAPLAAMPAQ